MVVWLYDAEGLDGGRHLDLTRSEEADLDPPQVPRYHGGQEVYQGLPHCLIEGAGGGKGGWESTSNSLIVI